MGYSLNRINTLGLPFQTVQEQIVLVPPSGKHTISNQVRKLLFMLTGECHHEVVGWNGPWGKVHLRPGDILAVPYHCDQSYYGLETGRANRLHVVRLTFDTAVLPPLPFGTRGSARVPIANSPAEAWAEYALRETRFLRAVPDSAVAETLFHLREEMEHRSLGYHPRVQALCLSLTILFARACAERQTGESPRAEGLRGQGHHVGKIKSYLRSRLHQPASLADVASFVGLSDEHTARLFKAATGMTVLEYGRRLRITEAKSLLSATDSNLSEIARQTGFASLGVFSRNFVRETGLTPSEFRRQISRQIG